MKKILWLILVLLLILSCNNKENKYKANQKKIDSRKPMSWGHKQTVYIFADDNVWKYAEQPLRETLERPQFTTTNETYFEIKRVKDIEQYYKFNNLLFLCDMESNNDISTYVKDIIGSKIKQDIKENSVGIFPKENMWANDQYVLFLIGNNERNLLTLNIKMANKIFNLYKEKLLQRIATQVYKTDVYSEEYFLSNNWKLELPKKYILYKKDIENNFISFLARLKEHSDRYISIYFEDLDKKEFGKQWLKRTRANLAWKYYDEDEFNDKDIKLENIAFGKYKGYKLSGRWQNMKYAVGGAFQSFAFYDNETQIAYVIDNSIYFPEGDKLPALLETEIISRTFKIK